MMTTYRAIALATVLALLPLTRPVSALVSDDEVKGGIDSDGYLATWLVLAPIALETDQEGAEGAAKEQVKDEAALNPKLGDKLEVGGKELTWKSAETHEGVIDFNAIVGEETEDSVAYAVTTVVADEEKADVVFKINSDDQVRVYLNGKPIHANDEARPLDKDEDDTVEGLTLKKGRNVVVLKIVNEGGDWEGSVRILDKEGKPLKGITATTKAEQVNK
jgi:hypothetical protein